jgi:hypothetical protein
MLHTIASAVLEGVRLVVGSVAILVAAIWVKLCGNNKGPYAVVPVLLAPIVVLDFLHLGGERER